jgi:FkbM family methyltransferase
MPRSKALQTLWHPHQKLWNWALTEQIRRRFAPGIVAQMLEAIVIALDSVALAARTGRRRRTRGAGLARSSGAVLYIDCGVHKEAEQVMWMERWFGRRYELHVLAFEAGADHARDAAAKLGGVERLRLHQAALVGPDHEGEVVRLYKGKGAGKADSLLRGGGEEFEDVPARRLSSILAEEGWDLARTPTILRMNIEGAEQFVIADLLAAGLAGEIDGYYGMWDDLSKIDPEADAEFQRVLAAHGISKLSFNDRDLGAFDARPLRFSPRALPATLRELSFRLRRRAISGDIDSAFQAGLVRTGGSDDRP